MPKFSIEKFEILGIESHRIKDENDEYWYPLTTFFKTFLFRTFQVQKYRDNEKLNKYMKIFNYAHPNSHNDVEFKTWHINTEGMFLILQELPPLKTKKLESRTAFHKKEKAIIATKSFFGVKDISQESKIQYINYTPVLNDYDVWSIMCLKHDKNINKDTIWKKCISCGFYYPDNTRYYERQSKGKDPLRNQCKQCRGSEFKCDNTKLQFIYQNQGLDLIFQIYKDDKEKIYEKLISWIF